MALVEEIYALGKAYPIIAIAIAIVLGFVGFKVGTRLLKIIIWAFAIIAVITALVMIFG